jgi:hypothetical protein
MLSEKIFKDSRFIKITENGIRETIELLISSGTEFSIIAKPKLISLNQDIGDISNGQNLVKLDCKGYSFETSMVVDGELVFRAGFGYGINIKESEVRIKLVHIFQIVVGKSSLVFMNFLQIPDTLEKKVNRSKLFLDKNRDKFR